jgi:hypothetical protein
MTKRRWIAVVLIVLVGVGLTSYLLTQWPYVTRGPVSPPKGELPQVVEGGAEPTSGQFVGHPESSILQRFGPPTHQWQGHYGNPPVKYRRAYSDAITVVYERPTGILYLSFCKEGSRLVCFSSDWLPAGWAF